MKPYFNFHSLFQRPTTVSSFRLVSNLLMIAAILVSVDGWGQQTPNPVIPPIKQVKLYGPYLPNRTFTLRL